MQDMQTDPKVTGRKTVLIVDDDPGILHVLANGLSNVLAMFDVLTAVNGQEAVELLEQRPVDVLVTDLVMPVMDGFALIAYVTNKRSTLPVVVLSGMAAQAMDAQLSVYGGLRVLRKPATYQAVAQCVLEEIERAERGQLEGIPLAGIVQLVESERRTCTILVRSGKRRGSLHFESGRLLHAFSDDFHADGEAAAFDILGWQDTAVEFEPLPTNVRRSVHTPLQLMLLDVAGAQDQLADAFPPDAGGDDTLDAYEPPAEAADPALADAVPEGVTAIAAGAGAMASAEDTVVEPGRVEPEGDLVEPPVEASPVGAVATDGLDDDPQAVAPAPLEPEAEAEAAELERPVVAAEGVEAEDPAPTADETTPTPAAEPTHPVAPAAAPHPSATVPMTTATSDDGQVDAMRGAIERLALRAREAEAALAAVATEVDAFREAQRRFDAVQEQRERRRRELEAFRDDVARLAREILGRVDGLFDAMVAEGADGPDGPRSPS